MEIHQFHPIGALSEPITDQMLAIRRLLREDDHHSEIYVLEADAGLRGKVKPLTTYTGGADHVLLIHHSFGFDSLEAVLAKPSRKVLVYHNVRPERFFSDPCMQRKLRLGRSQLSAYRPHVAYALATSNSNRRELLGRSRRHRLRSAAEAADRGLLGSHWWSAAEVLSNA